MRFYYKLMLAAGLLLGVQQARAQFTGTWAKADIPLPYNRRYQVGDILFDPAQDRADFALRPSGRIYQYYNFNTTYSGGRPELRRQLLAALRTPPAGTSGSGYLTVRFVVNFRGETDRFRVQELDSGYQPQAFAPPLVAWVLRACRDLHSWQPGRIDAETQDSYFYCTFIVREGSIQDVLL
ncbi:hypothetical protein KBK19_13545 [Microvirga sp. STR05]|uniref:TonB C-terminal domain-containing protein n=1 Tax=Hymenobacter duratus TaxID=2771356 RepID=A0ABR8JGT2_9BACT|nr:hypothetical protein [Hymenobacter duratus]MBD2716062.1 hypothetical protein [Hymenobacter duratus]MBR7950976.1 hypothetical protein [Microvirga sp. STR05]